MSSSISGPKFIEHDPVRPLLLHPFSTPLTSLSLPQYFDERKQQLDIFETQLRSLLTSLSSAAKARSTLSSSIAELESAFLALTQCDLSSTLRKLMNQAAEVQRKIHDLAEQQSAGDEVMGGLVSVVESYARLCASAKVRSLPFPFSPFDDADGLSLVSLNRRESLALVSRRSMPIKRLKRTSASSKPRTRRRRRPVGRTRNC